MLIPEKFVNGLCGFACLLNIVIEIVSLDIDYPTFVIQLTKFKDFLKTECDAQD